MQPIGPGGLRISSLVGSVAAGRRTHEPIPLCSTVRCSAVQARQGSLSNERASERRERATSEMSLDYGLLDHFFFWEGILCQ